jgi:aminoglycoside 6'-N-acetyltransferase I
MRGALWPGSRRDHEREIAAHFDLPPGPAECFVAELPGEGLVGFAEVGLRGYAEGCLSSPVGYLEGIFVVPTRRGQGVGRALVEVAERWARMSGCSEMASDRELDNEPSGAFHQALGYEEVERIVCFRKSLGEAEEAA